MKGTGSPVSNALVQEREQFNTGSQENGCESVPELQRFAAPGRSSDPVCEKVRR